jgi:hypothetical protein
MTPKGTGLIRSTHDSRDYTIAMLGLTIETVYPEEYQCLGARLGVGDQGGYGMCVAYSLKAIKEYQELKERGTLTKWSAAFIYGNRDPSHWQGEGMMLREALSKLITDGTCSNKLLGINNNYIFCKQNITNEMRVAAVPQKVAAYARCYSNNELKSALMNLGPVAIGFNIYDSFINCYDGMLTIPNTSVEKNWGGHAVIITGWKRIYDDKGYHERWVIQNSWGTRWGDNGYAYMPITYPIYERWTITDYIPEGTVPVEKEEEIIMPNISIDQISATKKINSPNISKINITFENETDISTVLKILNINVNDINLNINSSVNVNKISNKEYELQIADDINNSNIDFILNWNRNIENDENNDIDPYIDVTDIDVTESHIIQNDNKIISINASDFDQSTIVNNREWKVINDSIYIHGTALGTNINNGGLFKTGYVNNSPKVSYKLKFKYTGTYYLFVHGFGNTNVDDSIYMGFDNIPLTKDIGIDGFTKNGNWVKSVYPIKVNDISILHTLDFWIREDGFVFDKLVLVDSSIANTSIIGKGPNLSERVVIQEVSNNILSDVNVNNEYITIYNGEELDIDISEWILRIKDYKDVIFPLNSTLRAKEVNYIFSGKGESEGSNIYLGQDESLFDRKNGIVELYNKESIKVSDINYSGKYNLYFELQ